MEMRACTLYATVHVNIELLGAYVMHQNGHDVILFAAPEVISYLGCTSEGAEGRFSTSQLNRDPSFVWAQSTTNTIELTVVFL